MENCLFIDCKTLDDKKKKIVKLHKQLAHPSSHRLKTLLKDAELYDTEVGQFLDELSNTCDVCLRTKKTPARPVVSLPLATEFNEVVVLDLKEWNKGKIWILHLIDAATRFTLSGLIYNKHPSTIIDKIMTLWIGSGFGIPKKILGDNGGEFANEEYKDMCENLNIDVKHTAADSPWQNGLCERNHAVIDSALTRIVEDNKNIPLEIALVWAIHAKNCLHMNSGYSSYQLVFGRNPNLPNVLYDKPPALHGTTISKTFAQHINALHQSRQAFIKSESSERIRRALHHQIRVKDQIYETGDSVYYKRAGEEKWRGPGKVIGQDGKVIFVRHGSVYVRVSPCRLIKQTDDYMSSNSNPNSNTENSLTKNTDVINDTESSDDDEEEKYQNIHETVDTENAHTENNLNNDIENNETNNINQNNNPKIGSIVKYKGNDNNEWKTAKILSRGGKASGKYSTFYNIEDCVSHEKQCIDFKSLNNWETHDEQILVASKVSSSDVNNVKQLELSLWKKFNVYDEVLDENQKTLSTRWVITNKDKLKARLVVRGFEEEMDNPSDSPTTSKDTVRVFFALCSSFSWNVESIDIKSAFLQGDDIDRDIFVKPPPEALVDSTKVWKLNKVVYGLNDASRTWFFSVKNELLSLNCTQSSIDKALFRFYNGNILAGLFILHVDDFLYAGTECFKQNVIIPLCNKFQVGSQGIDCFKYIGLEIAHHEQFISLAQNGYSNTVSEIPINVSRRMHKNDMINTAEEKQLRTLIGQLNWIASQTRPDLSYDVLQLSVKVNKATVETLILANKIVRKLKSQKSYIVFPKLNTVTKLILYSDASYANLPDGFSSSGGYIIFLSDENDIYCPIAWSSTKIKRVVKSTLAAEAHALLDGLDAAYCIQRLLDEIFLKRKLKIHAFVDNKSLVQSVKSTTLVSEKRLRVTIAAIQQILDQDEACLKWIPTNKQIADCITKNNASPYQLLDLIKNNSAK